MKPSRQLLLCITHMFRLSFSRRYSGLFYCREMDRYNASEAIINRKRGSPKRRNTHSTAAEVHALYPAVQHQTSAWLLAAYKVSSIGVCTEVRTIGGGEGTIEEETRHRFDLYFFRCVSIGDYDTCPGVRPSTRRRDWRWGFTTLSPLDPSLHSYTYGGILLLSHLLLLGVSI